MLKAEQIRKDKSNNIKVDGFLLNIIINITYIVFTRQLPSLETLGNL